MSQPEDGGGVEGGGSGGSGDELPRPDPEDSLPSFPLLSIKVKTMAPATHDLTVNSESTVLALKQEVMRVSGVEAARQRLLFCGRVLADDARTLNEVGVRVGHTLHMVERPADLPPQPQNDVPPPPAAQQLPPRGVHRVAIGTINTGAGGAENQTTVNRLITDLISAFGNTLGGAGTRPAGAPGDPAAQGSTLPPGVQLQQLEISVGAGPAASTGAAAASPDDTAPRHAHPIAALDAFIGQLSRTLEGHSESLDFETGRRPVVSSGNPGPETSNENARHLAVECDLCGQCPIRGSRYKSLRHDNYDLCERCVRTERAREQEPFVQVDLPLLNQIHLDAFMAGRRGGARAAAVERARAALESVLGADGTPEGDSGEEGLDRRSVLALCELMRRARELLGGQAHSFLRRQHEAITSQVEEIGEDGGRHGVQAALVQTSSVLNAIGGIFIELGRLFGGVHLSAAGQTSAISQGVFQSQHSLGYVSANGSQVSVPAPASQGGAGLFPQHLAWLAPPGGAQGQRRPAPPTAPAAAAATTAARVQVPASTAAATTAARVQVPTPAPAPAGQSTVSVDNVGRAIQEQAAAARQRQIQVAVQQRAQMNAMAQSTVDSAIRAREAARQAAAAATRRQVEALRRQVEASSRHVEAAARIEQDLRRRLAESERAVATLRTELEAAREQEKQRAREEQKAKEAAAAAAAAVAKEKEKAPAAVAVPKEAATGAKGLGLGGLGLKQRRKTGREETAEAAPKGLGLGGPGLKPRRTVARTREVAPQARPAPKQPSSSAASSSNPLQGLMQGLMQGLGEPRGPATEEDEEDFETCMQKELSGEDQARWMATIARDELEQQEMRMIQFSDAYLSLDNID